MEKINNFSHMLLINRPLAKKAPQKILAKNFEKGKKF